MSDHLSSERRSWNMSRIRSKDTSPEKVIRSLLHKMGFRFRIHRNDLPGKPDIVLPKYKKVIFCHGCFWHQHPGCKKASMPKTNEAYWKPKLAANVNRFIKNKDELELLGWEVHVIWECETNQKDHNLLKSKLLSILNSHI